MIDITQPGGVERMIADIKQRMQESASSLTKDVFGNIDRSIRTTMGGKPEEEIFRAAQDAFAEADINAPDDAVHEYAKAVANNQPYKFNVDVTLQ